jgi:hypothetical protein
MTPKYSAQWWEKVAARPQQTPPEEEALQTPGLDGPSSSRENPRIKRKTKQEAS